MVADHVLEVACLLQLFAEDHSIVVCFCKLKAKEKGVSGRSRMDAMRQMGALGFRPWGLDFGARTL